MPTPRLIKYWGGRFRLIKENLPSTVTPDVQTKTLILLNQKYANFQWGNMSPDQRLQELDNYTYNLLSSYFI